MKLSSRFKTKKFNRPVTVEVWRGGKLRRKYKKYFRSV